MAFLGGGEQCVCVGGGVYGELVTGDSSVELGLVLAFVCPPFL